MKEAAPSPVVLFSVPPWFHWPPGEEGLTGAPSPGWLQSGPFPAAGRAKRFHAEVPDAL